MGDLSWGIAGTGTIALVLGRQIQAEPGMRVAAVGSRTKERAQGIAAELGAGRGYGSYAEMIADPDVDVVYVATPPTQHRPIIELAAAAGKAVLCEKPFAADAESAAAMIETARAAGIFVMEAMWLRFDPLVRRLVDLVADGILGDVHSVHATFGRIIAPTPTERLWDASRGGGCLLDFAVYPLSLGQLVLGEPSRVRASGVMTDSGVDTEVGLLLDYPAGRRGLYEASMVSPLSNTAAVCGTVQRAELGAPLFLPPHLTVKAGHGSTATVYERGFEPNGYVGELREVVRCLDLGLTETPLMPLADTVSCLQVIDHVRRDLSGRVGNSSE
jgi:predicted dehydrogenase